MTCPTCGYDPEALVFPESFLIDHIAHLEAERDEIWNRAVAEKDRVWAMYEEAKAERDRLREQLERGVDSTYHSLTAERDRLRAALEAIAKGEGRYNRDPLKHAANTIEDMQSLAREALAQTEGEK